MQHLDLRMPRIGTDTLVKVIDDFFLALECLQKRAVSIEKHAGDAV